MRFLRSRSDTSVKDKKKTHAVQQQQEQQHQEQQQQQQQQQNQNQQQQQQPQPNQQYQRRSSRHQQQQQQQQQQQLQQQVQQQVQQEIQQQRQQQQQHDFKTRMMRKGADRRNMNNNNNYKNNRIKTHYKMAGVGLDTDYEYDGSTAITAITALDSSLNTSHSSETSEEQMIVDAVRKEISSGYPRKSKKKKKKKEKKPEAPTTSSSSLLPEHVRNQGNKSNSSLKKNKLSLSRKNSHRGNRIGSSRVTSPPPPPPPPPAVTTVVSDDESARSKRSYYESDGCSDYGYHSEGKSPRSRSRSTRRSYSTRTPNYENNTTMDTYSTRDTDTTGLDTSMDTGLDTATTVEEDDGIHGFLHRMILGTGEPSALDATIDALDTTMNMNASAIKYEESCCSTSRSGSNSSSSGSGSSYSVTERTGTSSLRGSSPTRTARNSRDLNNTTLNTTYSTLTNTTTGGFQKKGAANLINDSTETAETDETTIFGQVKQKQTAKTKTRSQPVKEPPVSSESQALGLELVSRLLSGVAEITLDYSSIVGT